MSLAEIKPATETMSADDIGDWQQAAPAPAQPASGQATDMRRIMNALWAIHPSRADNYSDWLKIGRALRSLGDSYYSIFDAWSRQSARYGETREKWDSFGDSNRVTIGTLFWYATQDGWRPPSEPQLSDESEFKFLNAVELDDADFRVDYLIDDVLVAGQSCLIGGASKTLKTSMAVDMAISLASKTNFLGRFKVLKHCRVAIMSGESGGGVLQETARRICKARNITLRSLGDNFRISEDLPQCGKDADMEKLARAIKASKPDVLVLDPAYLTVGSDDPSNVFSQGLLLRRLNAVCVEHGVTLVIIHHCRKDAAKKRTPPKLEDMSMAGFAEFARQWLLIGRRVEYYPGLHDLWLVTGGSAGHSGLWQVTIIEGTRKDEGGRRWEVTANDHYAAQVKQEDAEVAVIRQLLFQHPQGLFKTGRPGSNSIAELSKLPDAKLNRALKSPDFVYRKPDATSDDAKVGRKRWFLVPPSHLRD